MRGAQPPLELGCFKHEKRCIVGYVPIGFFMVFESGYRGRGVVNICDRYFGSRRTSGFRPRYVEGGIFDASYDLFVLDYG